MAPGLVGAEKAARGKTPTDVWWHTIVSPNSREKTGYATQKPEALLRRIISASCPEGGLVADLFGGSGKSVLTASILLGIMILPTLISVGEASIRAVPESYYEGALALGATPEETVFKVMLPAAKSGLTAGVILAIDRSIGEAMAVSMVAGNQPIIPDSLFSGVRTLTANIVLEMGYAADMHREALLATGVVLFIFILLINLSFSLLRRRDDK